MLKKIVFLDFLSISRNCQSLNCFRKLICVNTRMESVDDYDSYYDDDSESDYDDDDEVVQILRKKVELVFERKRYTLNRRTGSR
jgi:hypothetical protein